MEALEAGDHVDSALILNENTEEILKQTIIRNLWSEAKTEARDFLKDPFFASFSASNQKKYSL